MVGQTRQILATLMLKSKPSQSERTPIWGICGHSTPAIQFISIQDTLGRHYVNYYHADIPSLSRLDLLRVCQPLFATLSFLPRSFRLPFTKARSRGHNGRRKCQRAWQHVAVGPTPPKAPFGIEAVRTRQQSICYKPRWQCRYGRVDVISIIIVRTRVLIGGRGWWPGKRIWWT